MLSNPRAQFDLARRLQGGESVPLGEVFTFLSGLYFRGKVAYARAFAKCPRGRCAVWVITSNLGLVNVDEPFTLKQLQEFSEVDIDHADARYRAPLERDARRIRKQFPEAEFVGRGDMSRGGLLLRCAVDRQELTYVPVLGATRRGRRPPKLTPRSYTHLTGI